LDQGAEGEKGALLHVLHWDRVCVDGAHYIHASLKVIKLLVKASKRGK